MRLQVEERLTVSEDLAIIEIKVNWQVNEIGVGMDDEWK